jgi:1-acyl-sn-glycerol-3-phosphate acyltransferase
MALLRSLLIVDPLIVLSTILHGCVGAMVSFFDSKGRRQNRVARAWARSLVAIARATVTVEGLERIDPGGRYVFASNHLSYMDTPVVLSSIPVQFRFLAKKGLFLIPFLGNHLRSAGHIPVPLENPRAHVKTLSLAAETIQSLGISLLIFPEGGRSLDGALQEFKEGAAYIAIKAQAPLVPIALIGTRRLLPMGSASFHPGPVLLRIGEPISTEGMTLADRHTLTKTVRERIVSMLNKDAPNIR